MRGFLLVSGLLIAVTVISPAQSQYVPYPASPGYASPGPAYAPPATPQYGPAAGPAYAPSARPQYDPAAPQYGPAAPQYGPALGRQAPGYQWREERATSDWRNNTWRERQPDVTRKETWREERANEDWHQRQGYAKETTRNNAADRGYVECGVGAAGTSVPCQNYRTEKPKSNTVEQTSVECGPGSVAESCRSRRTTTENDNPIVKQKKRSAPNE